MMQKLSFWAQALDNTTPDLIDLDGESLLPSEVVKREEVATRVSNVVEMGSRIFESGDFQLTCDREHFVLEVPSVQHDDLGRIAPIVCLGRIDALDDASVVDIFAGTQQFAHRIGRTLPPDCAELTTVAIDRIKKKFSAIEERRSERSTNPFLVIFWFVMRHLLGLKRK